MENRLKLKVIYRALSHAPFWELAEKTGMWEKNGLDVDMSPLRVREKAVEALKNGNVDIISGNHHNLFAKKAKRGEDFVHLAQVGNDWTDNRLVTSNGIKSVSDLRGKKILADDLDGHGGLNVWLFLLQEGLNADKGDVQLVSAEEGGDSKWQRVLKGEFDATFVGTPQDIRAARAGARVTRVRPMPMIRGVTMTTTTSFVRSHEEEIRRLIRGTADTIHFFRTKKPETLAILKKHVSPILGLENDEEVETLYKEWCQSIDPKPYPSMEAIANVFQLALRGQPDIKDFNPLSMWDLHYVRELDDSGYVDKLYQ